MERRALDSSPKRQTGSMIVEALIVVSLILLTIGLMTIKFTNKTQDDIHRNQFERYLR